MELIELIKAFIFGIIEGITEWLPISSTGHMILAEKFIEMNVSPEFWEVFLVVIQLGAIMAVVVIYFDKLNPFAPSKGKEGRQKTLLLWAKVVVACIPAAIIGLLFDDWVGTHFFNAVVVAIALVFYGIAFIVIERIKGRATTLARITHKQLQTDSGNNPSARHSHAAQEARAQAQGQEKLYSALQDSALQDSALQNSALQDSALQDSALQDSALQDSTDQAPEYQNSALLQTPNAGSYKVDLDKPMSDAVSDVNLLGFGRALGIGLFQCLAIIPGTSRSGSTILGGRILGVSREAAAEFSFFLAIPVMFGWSLLKVIKAFVLDGIVLTTSEWGVFAVGVIVAFVVSIIAIRFLMGYIRKHSFEVFGWYRIALGIAVLAYFALTGQLLVIQ